MDSIVAQRDGGMKNFWVVMIVIAGSVAGPASASCWLTVGSFGENPEQFVQYDSCSVSGPQNARSVWLMLRKVENPEVSPVTRIRLVVDCKKRTSDITWHYQIGANGKRLNQSDGKDQGPLPIAKDSLPDEVAHLACTKLKNFNACEKGRRAWDR